MDACRVSLSPESCARKETDVWFPKHQKWGDWLFPGDPLRLFLKSFLFSPSLWPVSLQRALKQRKIRRVRKWASSEAVIRPSVLNSALDLFCLVVKYSCQAELLKPTPVTLPSCALAHSLHPAVALPSPRNNPDYYTVECHVGVRSRLIPWRLYQHLTYTQLAHLGTWVEVGQADW